MTLNVLLCNDLSRGGGGGGGGEALEAQRRERNAATRGLLHPLRDFSPPRPPGCTNALMKYLPFYYYVPRVHRRFSPPLLPFPLVLGHPRRLAASITRSWIAPREALHTRESLWMFYGYGGIRFAAASLNLRGNS